MSGIALTDEQQYAVERTGNIAVTAGAGTGKTEVMTQRVLRVLGGMSHINELVVVTFTDKAAGELRQRVYHALLRRIQQTDGEERARFERMRDQFRENHISTMHAFFASLLRRFADAIEGLDPDFGILEGAEQEDVLGTSAERTLDAIARQQGHPLAGDLRVWLEQTGRKAAVRTAVEALIRRRVEILDWTQRFADGDPSALLEEYRELAGAMIAEARRSFFESVEVRRLWDEIVRICPRRDDPSDALRPAQTQCVAALDGEDLDALRGLLLTEGGAARSFGNVGSQGTWDKESLGSLRGAMSALAALVHGSPGRHLEWQEPREEATIRLLTALSRLTTACLDAYTDAKTRRHVLDFVDLEILVGRLLERAPVLRTLQRQFRAIFVDEFQDTNRYQWSLLRRLACEEGTDRIADDRLFVVGDEKQAIYAFRGGEVEVCGMAREELGETLGFAANFRSQPNLLLFFNRFFTPLLTGGAPYEAEAQDLRYRDSAQPPADSILNGGTVRHFVVRTAGRRPRGDDAPKAMEVEAHAIAAHLRRLCDGELEEEYPGLAAKIARGQRAVGVLFRRTTQQRIYENALRAFGVGFVAARGKGFYDRAEVRDLRNALRVIHDPRAEIALVGVLRSPLVGCSDGGLFLLGRRAEAEKRSLWEVLDAMGDPGDWESFGFTDDDAHALRKARELIRRWREAAATHTVAAMIGRVLEETGVYAPLSTGSDGRQRAANAEKFLDTARAFESQGAATLGDFLRFLDTQTEAEDDEGDADLPEGGAIQLLTVHRAKGLQWPLVIVPDTNAAFRTDIQCTRYWRGRRWDSGIAVGRLTCAKSVRTEVATRGRAPTHEREPPFLWQALTLEHARRTRAEQKRLLYVACTRAQEHLILCSHRDERGEPPPLQDGRSWAAWIHRILMEPTVTAETAPFFFEHVFTEQDEPRPGPPAPTGEPVAFDAALWQAPARGSDCYRLSDEPVGGRGQIRVHPSAATLLSRDAERVYWNLLGNRLLPHVSASAPFGPEEESALLAWAAQHARFAGMDVPEAALRQVVSSVVRVREWLLRTYPNPVRILWNQAFEWRQSRPYLIGHVDALVLDREGWTAVDVKYGEQVAPGGNLPPAYAWQAGRLREIVMWALGVETVNVCLLFADAHSVTAISHDCASRPPGSAL
jgi:ATP-dependent helicase/nuclease subunit A